MRASSKRAMKASSVSKILILMPLDCLFHEISICNFSETVNGLVHVLACVCLAAAHCWTAHTSKFDNS
uniref:Uncharacterized protein n=1 Tax=Gossypium raimondii TaxID=29730 RepID=A0A0D2VU48_GOSRA|nr:hypothetical protein B456_012G013000 [Gossypium raimondii]